MGNKKNSKRIKRNYFHGNQHKMSDQQNISPESASYSNMFSSTNSTSAKKLNKAVNCIGSSAKNKQTSNDLYIFYIYTFWHYERFI